MAMLQECERIAVELGCCKITLEVLDGNAPAKAAYEKFGFASYELDPAVGGAVLAEETGLSCRGGRPLPVV